MTATCSSNHTGQVQERLARIGILGPIELTGEMPVQLAGAKERCLLAALVVRRGEVVSDPYLVDALWGDHPPRTASKTLQNYVLRVRHALTGVEGLSIVTQPTGYSLRAPTAWSTLG
jgi:DNA-binding SARP family transcriptional activator